MSESVNLYNFGGLSQTYPWTDPQAKPKRSADRNQVGNPSYTNSNEEKPVGPRQNTDFNNIRFNTFFKDDLFTALPKYNVGGMQKSGGYFGAPISGVSLPIPLFEKASGWALKMSVGLTPLVYSFDNVTDDKNTTTSTLNLGGDVAMKFFTPRWYIGKSDMIFYGNIMTSLDYNLVGGKSMLDWKVNTFGLYFDDTPFIGSSKLDIGLKLFSKLNILDTADRETGMTASDRYMQMYGANDLENRNSKGEKNALQALWFQPSANIRWDDVPNVIPNNATVYGKLNIQNNNYLIGMTLNNSLDTSVNLEYGRNGAQPLFNVYAGQRFAIGQNLQLGLNLGVLDLLNKDSVSLLTGISLTGKIKLFGQDFNTHMNMVYHWDNIRLTKSNVDPFTWSGDTYWPGLAYDPVKGPEQVTHEFRFTTTGISVAGAKTITLAIGSNNPNGEDGIEFHDPDGLYMPGHADVRVTEVQVYDETLPPANRLIAGAGSALIGQTLTDITSGGVSCTLPAPRNGTTAKYTIVLRLSTNTGDFLPAPAIAGCNIKVTVKRE